MPLNIPPGFANFITTIRNLDGGISGRSTVSLGIELLVPPLNQSAVNSISNVIRDQWKVLYDNRWEVGPTHVVEGRVGADAVWDDPTAEAGTHSADTYAPPQVATVVTKSTGISGRAHRGRIYLPGVPSGSVGDDGGINPTYVTLVTNTATNIITGLIALGGIANVVLFHDTATPGSLAPDAIVSMFARSRAGTMRPRQRR